MRAELDRLRGLLNTDPLGGQVNPAAADRLRNRAAAVAARSADLARLRDGAGQRVAAVAAAAAAAHAAREDAAAACRRAAAKITAVPAVPADRTDLSARIAALDTLLAAGRWTRLSSELDLLERELASATSDFRDTERTVAGLLSRRDELRGLLDAYKAKAARLGAAEDPGLAVRYDQARELLWTAPCDLNAAADAVSRFQQAVLAMRSADGHEHLHELRRDDRGRILHGLRAGCRGASPSRRVRVRQLRRRAGPGLTASRRTSGARGSRRTSGRSARGRLGAGLVEIPPVPYRDPASAVLADPQVPENRALLRQLRAARRAGQGRSARPDRRVLPELRHAVLVHSRSWRSATWSPGSTRCSAASPSADSAGSTWRGTATSATAGWC